MKNVIRVWNIGNINYAKSVLLQKYMVDLHNKEDRFVNTLLLVEHPPVYTTGIRTKTYSTEEENRLKNLGADFYRTDRGGLITFHGPGQLVVYPIINLKDFKAGVRWYVCHIEKTIIHLCEKLGLKAETSPHTGVWINDNKVCAIGIHASRYITSHGLALNCCTDLKWFENIVPCGIDGKGVTSLTKELHRHISIEEVIPTFLDSFAKIFNCNYENFPIEKGKTILTQIETNIAK